MIRIKLKYLKVGLSFTNSLTHSLTYSLTHLLTYSFTYSLTYQQVLVMDVSRVIYVVYS